MLTILHRLAAYLAATIVAVFFLATLTVELFGGATAIAQTKTAIAWGLPVLVPAIAATGITGRRLAQNRAGPVIKGKRRRTGIIAAAGLFILIPSALFLSWKAGHGALDATFYLVQAAELLAGAMNLTLMVRNIRAGRQLARATRRRHGNLHAGKPGFIDG